MNKKDFIDKVINENPIVTDEEKTLVETMESISRYFSDIYSEIYKTELDPSLFGTGSNGNMTHVSASYKNIGLQFHREKKEIEVKMSTDNFMTSQYITDIDTIDLAGNIPTSKKYGLPLSEELLNKYLNVLVN